MTNCEMTRSQFLRNGGCLMAGAVLSGILPGAPSGAQAAPASTAAGDPMNAPPGGAMRLRPYQLLCAICETGQNGAACANEKLRRILEEIRRRPDVPITLVCNLREVFGFQTSGPADDTSEGADFNKRRDLDILLRLNLPPGVTLSARILLHRLLDTIPTVSGICDFATVTSEAWTGCPKAKSGCYEKGREKGIAAIIPARTKDEMAAAKRASWEAMHQARSTGIAVKPHLLLCSVCQYGDGARPPYPEDNLPELLQLVLKEPGTLITMTEGAPWMVCGPCPMRVAELNACVNIQGSGGLTNQLRDLRTLQLLGMSFGSTMNAQELYRRLLERVPSTLPVCRFESLTPSVWSDPCGARTTNSDSYRKGRELLIKELA
jgi:hypothetical protein